MPAWGYHVFDVTILEEARVDSRAPAQLLEAGQTL